MPPASPCNRRDALCFDSHSASLFSGLLHRRRSKTLRRPVQFSTTPASRPFIIALGGEGEKLLSRQRECSHHTQGHAAHPFRLFSTIMERAASKPLKTMKTKLLILCAALLPLGSFTSCYAPYNPGYHRSHHHPRYHSGYRRSPSLGGYRGGGNGGGFGGSFGGF